MKRFRAIRARILRKLRQVSFFVIRACGPLYQSDPTMRRVVGGREKDRVVGVRTTRKNLKAIMDVAGKWIDRVRQRRSLDKLILDLNSSISETYVRRERPSSLGGGERL